MDDDSLSRGLTGIKHGWVPAIRGGNNPGWVERLAPSAFPNGNAGERR